MMNDKGVQLHLLLVLKGEKDFLNIRDMMND